jgi:hypothetical protein
MRSTLLRSLLLVLLATPLVACNTVQGDGDGASFAVLSTGAQNETPATAARSTIKKGKHPDAGRYFVEFRSRYALSYGHTFLVYGRLNEKGEVGELTDKNVAGFHPAGAGSELWMIGHAVPVPAETGPSDGDLEEEYVSARYRVYLTEAEYRTAAAHINAKRAKGGLWHAATYNCNLWVGEIATFMGLKAPSSHWLYPANYINEMKRLNTGEELPASAAAPATEQSLYTSERS